jgi:tetratricopeptide (TPR) repeat protein
LQDLNEAIRLQPDDALAYNNRGGARGEQGDVDGALQDYDMANRLGPYAPNAQCNYAQLCAEIGERRTMMDDYRRYLDLIAAARGGNSIQFKSPHTDS